MKFIYLFEQSSISVDPGKPTPALGLPLIRHLMKPGSTELALCEYRVRPSDIINPLEDSYKLSSVSCLSCKQVARNLLARVPDKDNSICPGLPRTLVRSRLCASLRPARG
jgi:hypothetical protein